MEVMRELMKRPRSTDNLAIGCFVVAVLYTIFRGTPHTILVGLGFTLIVLGALPKQVALAFLVGTSAILLVQTRESREGFEDVPAVAEAVAEASAKASEEEEKPEKPEGFATEKVMLPDNADRKEMLELGKAYKLPNEEDDKGFHLDSGTTFLNAYKALKPDQIAAMTKDTQDLLATQKSLVAMLDSFGPLMKDMGKITGFFNPSAAAN